ncbi:NUDIX hydrolase [Actinokineospora bangkokensis]|uniref:Coenzyme A pyrophosphatase n=1 Tax=Actinokineospora bangkokensis TaxID=1193682 RepID=A0A1Q9LCG8_9PSEU|nr:CoA pyrophosphatase [Actinokineospora bangkokensis]OLR89705.1 coenzyme A pyrophosphatase [Actinokineospora bangkokensis]
MTHGPLVDPAELPGWLAPLVRATGEVDADAWRRVTGGRGATRDAAVLVLFGETDEHGPDLLFQLRAESGGSHSGQVAFPGGSAEPGDGGPVATALREAVEETGLDPAGVVPAALLPQVVVPVSGFRVTPVLGWWRDPSDVRAVDPAESQAVARIPLAHLADPANRFMVTSPGSRFTGPAFSAPGMLIWGFTAGLLTAVLHAGGWERPWDTGDVRDLSAAWRAVGSTGAEV